MKARVTSLDVRCPACGMPPGTKCAQLDGTGPTMPHEQRRRVAREQDQERNPEHMRGQLPLFPAAVAS